MLLDLDAGFDRREHSPFTAVLDGQDDFHSFLSKAFKSVPPEKKALLRRMDEAYEAQEALEAFRR